MVVLNLDCVCTSITPCPERPAPPPAASLFSLIPAAASLLHAGKLDCGGTTARIVHHSSLRQGRRPGIGPPMFWGGCGDDTGTTNVRPAGQPHALRAQQASAAGRAGGKFPTVVAASGSAAPAAAGRYGAARHSCCRAPALCFARAARARGRGIPDSSTAPSSPADTALFPHGSRGESEGAGFPFLLPSAQLLRGDSAGILCEGW